MIFDVVLVGATVVCFVAVDVVFGVVVVVAVVVVVGDVVAVFVVDVVIVVVRNPYSLWEAQMTGYLSYCHVGTP